MHAATAFLMDTSSHARNPSCATKGLNLSLNYDFVNPATTTSALGMISFRYSSTEKCHAFVCCMGSPSFGWQKCIVTIFRKLGASFHWTEITIFG